MGYTLHDIYERSDDRIGMAVWLNDEHFIEIEGHTCQQCNNNMALQGYMGYSEGVKLHCIDVDFRADTSVRIGSYFQCSHLRMFYIITSCHSYI